MNLLFFIILAFSNSYILCSSKQQRLLLVSFDGFRYDYIDKYNLTAFKMLINDGVKAKFMRPQFTTQTYPNHWSIVTGLYEESHGIVGNTFFDPLFNETFIRNDTNLKWWNATMPIWFTAVKNNLKTGTYFWPGSEVIYFNTDLYNYKKYDEKLIFKPKVDQVIEWFVKEKYVFATIYDPQPDYDGHFFGLDSEKFNSTIKQVNADVDYLISKLKESNLYDAPDFNLIILSDHGMANTDKIVMLDNYTSENEVIVLAAGGNNIHLKVKPTVNQTDLVERLRKMPRVSVFLKNEIPDNWHYKNNRRVGDILLVAQEGVGLYSFIGRKNSTQVLYKADHGYDKFVQNNQASFVAKGALFKSNYISANEIENIDVYPLLCHILSIECLPNNGSFERIKQFLKSNNSQYLNANLAFIFVLNLIANIIYYAFD